MRIGASGRERRAAFTHAQNGAYFDNVDFFGNQASGFIGAILSLSLSSATCNIGNDIFDSFLSCRVGAVNEDQDFLRGAAGA